ncbi:MAG: hypothetical protein WCS89_02900 [Candidatus Paceibacterota bacterium]
MFTKNKIKKFVSGVCVIAIVFVSSVYPLIQTAQAQAPAPSLGVPISTGQDFQSVMNYQKNFTLDKIATMIAKQILHQMTASVVNWINSGFKGSPAFLTNPEAFFLDVGDQITGAFLAGNGPLSSLCSPFVIDLSLSLALGQTSMADQRYTCTLGRIIEAQKNGPEIIVNGRSVRSSSGSMNGFLGGDFNQGGWPAFIALTTEQQNNPYGATLAAQSDLRSRISARQNVIKADIQLGSGFMSWQSCKDIPGASNVDPEDQVSEVGNNQVQNGDGTTTYQQCETQTPGSVISGTLQKNLNVPVTELELADNINAVINALVTQMISTMLSSGLNSLSGNSGGGQSYTQQVINDSNSSREAQEILRNLQPQVASSLDQVESYVSLYKQSVNLLTDSKSRYTTARTCFINKNTTNAMARVATIDAKINNTINPPLDALTLKYNSSLADKKKLTDINYFLTTDNSLNNISRQSQNYTDFVTAGGTNYQPKFDDALASLSETQRQVQSLNTESASLLRECQGY